MVVRMNVTPAEEEKTVCFEIGMIILFLFLRWNSKSVMVLILSLYSLKYSKVISAATILFWIFFTIAQYPYFVSIPKARNFR